MVVSFSKTNAFFKVAMKMLVVSLASQRVFFHSLHFVKFFFGLWSLWSLCRCRIGVELVCDLGVHKFDYTSWNFFIALKTFALWRWCGVQLLLHINPLGDILQQQPTLDEGESWMFWDMVACKIPNFYATHIQVRIPIHLKLQPTQNHLNIVFYLISHFNFNDLVVLSTCKWSIIFVVVLNWFPKHGQLLPISTNKVLWYV